MVDRYPEAEWVGDGTEYGPLPDSGYRREDVRLVMHTTETAGMPSYSDGDNAPHYTYDPEFRQWFGHADLDKRVGTDKSAGNPCSIAVEMLAYSDRDLAGERGSGHIWVGDFSDENFEDLADFGVWLMKGPWPELNLGNWVYGPADDFPTYLYGTNAETRMSWAEWDAAGGFLLAHGASPSGTTHWDSGAFDLHRLSRVIRQKLEEPPPDDEPIDTSMMFPVKYGDAGGDVQFCAALLHYRGRDIEADHEVFDDVFKAALLDELPNSSGKNVHGRQAMMIIDRLIKQRVDEG